jgi:hypothetical protein
MKKAEMRHGPAYLTDRRTNARVFSANAISCYLMSPIDCPRRHPRNPGESVLKIEMFGYEWLRWVKHHFSYHFDCASGIIWQTLRLCTVFEMKMDLVKLTCDASPGRTPTVRRLLAAAAMAACLGFSAVADEYLPLAAPAVPPKEAGAALALPTAIVARIKEAVSFGAPDLVAAAIASLAAANPELAVPIAAAAAQADPPAATYIATAVAVALPSQAATIAAAVSQAVPAQSTLITAAVSRAVPAAAASVLQAVAQATNSPPATLSAGVKQAAPQAAAAAQTATQVTASQNDAIQALVDQVQLPTSLH